MPEEKTDRPGRWRTEGVPRAKPHRSPKQERRRRRAKIVFMISLLVANVLLVNILLRGPHTGTTLPYDVFARQLETGNVQAVQTRGDTIQGTLKKPIQQGTSTAPVTVSAFQTQRPTFATDDLLGKLLRAGVTVNAEPITVPRSFLASLILSIAPWLVLIGAYVLVVRTLGSRFGAGLGRSKAKLYDPEAAPRVTFEDVAGIDEVEAELSEIVEMLREPERYEALGAKIPRGVLLEGMPGTGKTLLARAVAGEADVPFFSASASEFIELVVGVGASRVRDLFAEARKVAPALVFIDEIDAVGRARGGSHPGGGGLDEREQTLNQILTEMDGFTGREGVIVIAATNRTDVLDAALLRPGRFDRRVTVSAPDRRGREAILRIHTRHVPLGAGVDLGQIAGSTPGMVGADLENLVNEAALLAVRHGRDAIETSDLTQALEKVVLGTARHIVIPQRAKERTAYHEAGHAILGMVVPGADPVRKVSIVPRGPALGVTFQSPDEDRYGYTADELRARIVGALGGRAAEEIAFGDVSTGAEADLEHVATVARLMVGRWGMSTVIGPVAAIPGPAGTVDGQPPSEHLRVLVDEEVRRIAEECYETALVTLQSYRENLEALVQALLERETLDEADTYAIAGIAKGNGGVPTAETTAD